MKCRQHRTHRVRLMDPHYATGSGEPSDQWHRVPASASRPKRVIILCHHCAYTPPGDIPADGMCPKCGRGAWERYAIPEPLVPAHMKK